jgi:hypothetical protein
VTLSINWGDKGSPMIRIFIYGKQKSKECV